MGYDLNIFPVDNMALVCLFHKIMTHNFVEPEGGWRGQIDKLFYILKERKGSDLHISVGAPPLIRVSGDLIPVTNSILPPAEDEEAALRNNDREPTKTVRGGV